jgi:putative membrane protein
MNKKFMRSVVYALALCLLFSSNLFSQPTQKLSDPEIASVALVANQNDIGFAEIAQKRSFNPEILQFAQAMTNDHKAIMAKALTLVKRRGITPKNNAVSQKLLADAATTRAALKSKSAKDFDKAYIDNEVDYHNAGITAVEGQLIPAAQNSELKDLLLKMIPPLKTHLSHAEMIQAKFK